MLFPGGAPARIAVLAVAAATDLLVGDPHWLWHPVQGIGALVCAFEALFRSLFGVPWREGEAQDGKTARTETGSRALRERLAGLCMTAAVLAASCTAAALLLGVCGRIGPRLRILAEGILCGRLLALRSLAEAGRAVRDPLRKGDIEGARRAVSMIVGRDTDRLDAEGIAKAAVETVAENTSDGVAAPFFYMVLFGGLGGVLYKAVNTMDSMVGYKNARYRYFGTAAARLDDGMNLLPSRLTALCMILACWLPAVKKERVRLSPAGGPAPGCARPRGSRHESSRTGAGRKSAESAGVVSCCRIPDGKDACRIWRRDRKKSPSPNAAQTESACAGALHIRLLGDAWYFGQLHRKEEIGDGGRPVEPEDITRAVRLLYGASGILFAAAVCILLYFSHGDLSF